MNPVTMRILHDPYDDSKGSFTIAVKPITVDETEQLYNTGYRVFENCGAGNHYWTTLRKQKRKVCISN